MTLANDISLESGTGCIIKTYDIRDGDSGKKPGFQDLLEATRVRDIVRVFVAGGDGTVMWTIQESILHGIDLKKVAFGVIPYGTGNDFSRTLKWGYSPPSNKKEIISLMKSWLSADIEKFDLWSIRIKVSSDGGNIWRIKDKKKTSIESLALVKPMINYFSIGAESRVGFGFDKHRTKSQALNKAVYFTEGIKKTLTRTTLKINDVVSTVSSGTKTIFSSDICGVRSLCNNPVSLVFLNIPSFSAGCDVWRPSRKYGLQKSSDKVPDVLNCKQIFSLSTGRLKLLKPAVSTSSRGTWMV
jgi:diacylglycerol kinase (ATP)